MKHMPGPCGCSYESHVNQIHGRPGISMPVGRIAYCAVHAAAADALELVREVVEVDGKTEPAGWLARARALLAGVSA